MSIPLTNAESAPEAAPETELTEQAETMANPPVAPAAVARFSALDQRFLGRITELVQTHLADEGFGVDQLAEAVAMSRTQVHRKLKALTGQSPGEYIRLTRLHQALALLQAREGTVAEVAYRVGYGSAAHFSTAFSRQFGFPPSMAHQQPPSG